MLIWLQSGLCGLCGLFKPRIIRIEATDNPHFITREVTSKIILKNGRKWIVELFIENKKKTRRMKRESLGVCFSGNIYWRATGRYMRKGVGLLWKLQTVLPCDSLLTIYILPIRPLLDYTTNLSTHHFPKKLNQFKWANSR